MGFDEINSIEEFKFKVNELSASQEKIRNLHSLENGNFKQTSIGFFQVIHTIVDEYEDKEIKFGRKRKKSKRSRFISNSDNKSSFNLINCSIKILISLIKSL